MNILVTGGSKGIGRATALRFSASGNNVFINYSNDDQAAQDTAGEVESRGGIPHLLKFDVGNPEQVKIMAQKIRSTVSRLDLIVHCVVAVIPGYALEISPENWRRAVAVDSLSLVDVIREIKPMLGYGSSIVALSSRGATNAVPNYAALGAPKALTESLVRYLAVDLAPEGIRVNVVAPGALDTAAFRSVFPENYEARLKAAADANPSGRGLTFDDVTGTIAFLASPEAQMIQGRVIVIDGGLNIK